MKISIKRMKPEYSNHYYCAAKLGLRWKELISLEWDDIDFENAVVAVTPTDQTSPVALEVVREMWNSVGAEVLEISPEKHDQTVAATSHLPHVMAALICRTILGATDDDAVRQT